MSTVTLTVRLRGGKLLSEEQCALEHRYKKNRVVTETLVKKKEGKKIFKKLIKEAIDYKTRDTENIYQTINISEEAFAYWTSRNKQDKPAWMDIQTFKASDSVRVAAWCGTIAHDLGGVVEDFTILND